MKYIILLLCTLCLSACSKIIFTAANTPVLSYDGEIIEDVKYGELPRQTLDIYIPEIAKEQALPVIVFFHGGRWSFGNKDQYKFVGSTLSELGYVVVLPNTRLYPEVKFPTFVEDAALSISWIYNNIGKHSGAKQVFISGHSSGAHIGALLVADERYLQAVDIDSSRIQGFAGMAGPYDFVPQTEDLKDMFGPPSNFPNMVVSNFIDGSEAPMLLMYSKNDETVHIRNLNELKAKIESENGIVKSIIYEDGEHASTVAALSWANPADLPVAQDMHAFFQAQLSNNDSSTGE